jgi:hypothetical protein
MRGSTTLLPLLLAALAAASCGDEAVEFDVKSPAPAAGDRPTISLLGVFRDGRMSPESLPKFAPPLGTTLGASACDPAFGDALAQQSPELYASVDEDTKADGVTEEIIDKLAPAAAGDLILTFSVHGRVGPTTPAPKGSQPQAAAPAASQPMGRGGGRGRGMGSAQASPPKALAKNELDISASFFSVHLHHAVGKVSMRYMGPSLEDAVGKFMTKLGTVVPGYTCRGWHFEGNRKGLATPAAPAEPPAEGAGP